MNTKLTKSTNNLTIPAISLLAAVLVSLSFHGETALAALVSVIAFLVFSLLLWWQRNVLYKWTTLGFVILYACTYNLIIPANPIPDAIAALVISAVTALWLRIMPD